MTDYTLKNFIYWFCINGIPINIYNINSTNIIKNNAIKLPIIPRIKSEFLYINLIEKNEPIITKKIIKNAFLSLWIFVTR